MTGKREEGEIFDRAALEERLMGDPDLTQEIIESFMSDMRAQLAELRAALNAEDAKEVRFRAHTIKGAAANVSAVGVQRVASETEQAAIEDGPQGAAPFIPKLAAALERLKAVVEQGRA